MVEYAYSTNKNFLLLWKVLKSIRVDISPTSEKADNCEVGEKSDFQMVVREYRSSVRIRSLKTLMAPT